MTKPYLLFKRLMDVAVAAVLLVVLSPIILLSLVVQWIEIGSSPIFFQERPGRNEKIFKIFKLKTMNEKRGADGELLEDRLRITRLGAFFRSASIDELPQLINVLKGDMSFVGPRPLLIEYLPLYNEHQKKRHLVRPGITGLAQINGRNAISWNDKFDFDVNYVNDLSCALDLQILIKTVLKVLKRQGIQSGQEVTMPKFTGNEDIRS
jgi:lipopolysaccharide/colanic/teichoic acid biosynthesis glycosyltransferase